MLDKKTNTLYFSDEEHFGALELKANGKKLNIDVKILSDELKNRFYSFFTPYVLTVLEDTVYTVEVLSKRSVDQGSPSKYQYAITKKLYNNIDNTPSKTSIILTTMLGVDNVSSSYIIEYDTATDAKKAEEAFTRILKMNYFVVINSKTKIKFSKAPKRLFNRETPEEVKEKKKPAGIFNSAMIKGIKK